MSKTKGLNGSDPLCVYFADDEGDSDTTGWCLAKSGPDRSMTTQRTGCGKTIVLPDAYKQRKPTCSECLELFTADKIPAQAGDIKLLVG